MAKKKPGAKKRRRQVCDAASREFLQRLLETPSPSGYEQKAQGVIEQYIKPYAEESRRDAHGNLIAGLNPQGRPRVMLAGHVDEIGLMVIHVDDKGFLWVRPIGGPDVECVVGARVQVHGSKGPVLGVVGKKPIHHQTPEDRKKVSEWKDVFVDVGAAKKSEVEKLGLRPGDCITLEAGVRIMPPDIWVARGFDDRIGAFVVMEALRLLSQQKDRLKAGVYAVSTVQEEIGLRGARTSAFGVDPEVGIAVDVGFATDFPGEDKKLHGEGKLGEGPMICRGPNVNPALGELLEKTAQKEKIPYQLDPSPGATGTDANAMQLTRAGVAAALVSVPTRYVHTPVEMLHFSDAEACAALLAATILRLKPGMDFVPK